MGDAAVGFGGEPRGYGWRLHSDCVGSAWVAAAAPGRCPGCGAAQETGRHASGVVVHPWGCPVAVRLCAEWLAVVYSAGATGSWRAAADAAARAEPDPFGEPACHWRAVAAEPEPFTVTHHAGPDYPVAAWAEPDCGGIAEGPPPWPGATRPDAAALLAALRGDGSPFRPAAPGHLLFGASVCRPADPTARPAVPVRLPDDDFPAYPNPDE